MVSGLTAICHIASPATYEVTVPNCVVTASSGTVRCRVEASYAAAPSGVGRSRSVPDCGRTRASGAAISGNVTTKVSAKAAINLTVSRRSRQRLATKDCRDGRTIGPSSGRCSAESGVGRGSAAVCASGVVSD